MSAELPWRGPGPDRPDLPLPPDKMRVRRGGRMLKRWLYVGAFTEQFLLSCARVQVGPLGQTFWVIFDREGDVMHEHTAVRLPGARGEVWTEEDGSVHIRTGKEVRVKLRPGEGAPVEAVCPTPEEQYTWTRKSADVPVHCDVRVNEKRWRAEAPGVLDDSAGYHPRHTVWSWSAGVGRTVDGRSIGWNLVNGINDPPRRSERAIWVEGAPFEPGPVEFEGLEAVTFDDGSRLIFEGECERTREENRLFVRSAYRQPLGTFSGSLAGIELERGLGVMEHHDAVW
jgi:hypothetical protein